jgi:hypothetical protein
LDAFERSNGPTLPISDQYRLVRLLHVIHTKHFVLLTEVYHPGVLDEIITSKENGRT